MNFPSKPNKAGLWLLAAIGLAAAPAHAGILYGTDFRSYNGISGHPVDSALHINRSGTFDAYCLNGTESGDRRLIYPFDIPNGFEIFAVRVWGRDSSTSNDLDFQLVESCQPLLAAGIPSHTALANTTTNGSAGGFSLLLFADQYPVDAAQCAYYLEARFAADDSDCADYDLGLTRVRILTNNPDVIFRNDFGQWGD